MRKYALGLTVCSVLGVFIFYYLFYSQTGYLPADWDYVVDLIVSILVANAIGFILYNFNVYLDQKIPWRVNSSLRLLFGIIFNFLISLVVASVAIGLLISTELNVPFDELFSEYGEPLAKLAIILMTITMIYSIVYMTLFSYHQYSVVQIEKVKLERKQLSLQFDALRSQLSPHYLFNCLNTISSLVYKDADLAESFIRRLAQTYQFILTNNERQLVLIKDEIEFVKSYYYLMKVRFDNSIDLSIDISDPVINSYVPPLTLQILVENAIKHNQFSKDEPLEIKIESIEDKILIVSNNVSNKPKQVTSFKVGLENISRRYEFFTPVPVKVSKETTYRVQLPVIPTKESLEKVA